MTKNGGRIWAHDWENSGGPAGRKELADRCSLTMSLSGASASAAAKQRHQEQRRADTSALADAARGQRQMPELPPYVPEFDLAFMSKMLGVGAVRSEPEDPATGDDDIASGACFLVLRYISPLATSRSAVRPWMVRWSSPSSIEPSISGHRV